MGDRRPRRRRSTRRCSTRSRRAPQGRGRARASPWSGPHRDEWRLLVGGLESRTHASQGEQRTLALALRLGGHRLCAELTGSSPVLFLDDVFSELDDQRAVALVAHLDAGQTLVTTAGTVPRGISADRSCASTPAVERRRERGEPVPGEWSQWRATPATSRCRWPTRWRRSVPSSGSPPGRRARRPSTRAGTRSSAPTSRPTRGSSRCATASLTVAVDDPHLGDPAALLGDHDRSTRATGPRRARRGDLGAGARR